MARHPRGADDSIAGLVVIKGDAAARLEANGFVPDPFSQRIGAGMLDELELKGAVADVAETIVVGPADVLRCAARGLAFEVVVLLPDREIRIVGFAEPSDLLTVRRRSAAPCAFRRPRRSSPGPR